MSDAKETRKTQKKYDRIAWIYDSMEFIAEKSLFHNFRKNLLRGIEGKVLEIGVGTGKNLPYYSPKAEITAIDISPKMMDKAKARADKLGLNADFHLMDAENLKFKDNSFDYVVATFVFCSVPDPVKALKEIKRVVKSNGQVLFIEHVLSRRKMIAPLQHIFNPVARAMLGANINRDTKTNINNAALNISKDEKLAFFDVFRRFTCRKADSL